MKATVLFIPLVVAAAAVPVVEPAAVAAGPADDSGNQPVRTTPPRLQVYPDPQVPVDEPANQPAFEDINVVPYSLWEVPLPQRVTRSQNSTTSSGISEFKADFSAVFDEAAHFPMTGFASCGGARPRDAALIYEGMTLAVAQSGRYEVRMVIEAPRRPTVIRMQLQIQEYVQEPQADGPPTVAVVPRGTITLAPIALDPDPDARRHETSHTYLVRRGGYSHLLREISLDDKTRFCITRIGTARFGSIPD